MDADTRTAVLDELVTLARRYGPQLVHEAYALFRAHAAAEIDSAASEARAHIHDAALERMRRDNGDGHQ